jgi:hypothetical protein
MLGVIPRGIISLQYSNDSMIPYSSLKKWHCYGTTFEMVTTNLFWTCLVCALITIRVTLSLLIWNCRS